MKKIELTPDEKQFLSLTPARRKEILAWLKCKYAEICGDGCDDSLKKPVAEWVEGECQYVDQNKRLRIQIEGSKPWDPVLVYEAMEQMGKEQQ